MLLIPMLALTFSGGAPARRTGAPGERTCNSTGCHNTFALNSGTGRIVIGLPEGVQPATTAEVRIDVSGSATRYGFEITALDEENNPVGDWLLTDSTAFAGTSTAHVTHRFASQTGTWVFHWHAPDAVVGPVTFYAAGVEGNGRDGNQGDHVYTTQATLNVAIDVGNERDEIPDAMHLFTAYPNPFRDEVTLSYTLTSVQPVTLSVFDLQGRKVQELIDGIRGVGWHTLHWDSRDLSSGRYILQFQMLYGAYTRVIIKE